MNLRKPYDFPAHLPDSAVIVWFLLLGPQAQAHLIAAAIFAIASLTDWLDGYLARKLDQATELGAFLDPVADKLLVVVVIMLVLLSAYPALLLPVAIIVVRELVISALREWTAAKGKRVAVAFTGKLKATIQMIAIIALLMLGGRRTAPISGCSARA